MHDAEVLQTAAKLQGEAGRAWAEVICSALAGMGYEILPVRCPACNERTVTFCSAECRGRA